MNITEITLCLNEFFHKCLPLFAVLDRIVINSQKVAAHIYLKKICGKTFLSKQEKWSLVLFNFHYSREILLPFLLNKI